MSAERTRPAGLWVVGILAILLGALGACGGAFQLGSIAIQDAVIEAQERMIQQTQGNDQSREFQLEIQRRSLEIAREWRIPTIATLIANVLGSLMLLISAILLFTWNPNALVVFIAAAAFSILVDASSAGLGVVVGQQTMAAMQEAAREIGTGGQDRMMGGIVQASGSLGICWAIGWLLAKVSFYVGGILYLRKETVRVLFS